VLYERVTGWWYPSGWVISDAERKLLGDKDAMSDNGFRKHLIIQYSQG
jgi:hypothetical protein